MQSHQNDKTFICLCLFKPNWATKRFKRNRPLLFSGFFPPLFKLLQMFSTVWILSHRFVSPDVAFFQDASMLKKKAFKQSQSNTQKKKNSKLHQIIRNLSIDDILQSSFCRSGFVPYSRTWASEWTIWSSSREAFLPRIHCMDEETINIVMKQ